jgi:hypothetical protein
MLKVIMVGHFVSDSHKVMTTPIAMIPFRVLLWSFLCRLIAYLEVLKRLFFCGLGDLGCRQGMKACLVDTVRVNYYLQALLACCLSFSVCFSHCGRLPVSSVINSSVCSYHRVHCVG